MFDEAYDMLVHDEESKLMGRMQEKPSDGVSFAMQFVLSASLCGKQGITRKIVLRRLAILFCGENEAETSHSLVIVNHK